MSLYFKGESVISSILVLRRLLLVVLVNASAWAMSLPVNAGTVDTVRQLSLPLNAPAITLNVATSSVKPWGYVNEQGINDGLLVQFIESFVYRLEGFELHNQLQPFPRVIHSLKLGDVDMAVLFDSTQSLQIGERIGLVGSVEILVVGRTDKPDITNLQQMSGWQVGYIRGSRYGEVFNSVEYLNRVALNNMKQGLSMLLAGRLDAMVSAAPTLFYALETMQLPVEEFKPLFVLDRATAGLYLSHKSSLLGFKSVFQTALEQMRSQGELERLRNRPRGWDSPHKVQNEPGS